MEYIRVMEIYKFTRIYKEGSSEGSLVIERQFVFETGLVISLDLLSNKIQWNII